MEVSVAQRTYAYTVGFDILWLADGGVLEVSRNGEADILSLERQVAGADSGGCKVLDHVAWSASGARVSGGYIWRPVRAVKQTGSDRRYKSSWAEVDGGRK